jgi:hypothetical protein
VLNEFSGKGMSALLVKAIFQDHLINDLAAKDAPPSKKFFTYTVELLVNHDTTTSMTLHMSLLRNNNLSEVLANFIPKGEFFRMLNDLNGLRYFGMGLFWYSNLECVHFLTTNLRIYTFIEKKYNAFNRL